MGVRTCEGAPFIPLTDRNKVNQEVSRLCGLAEILHRSKRSRQERIVFILDIVSIGSANDDDTDSPVQRSEILNIGRADRRRTT